MKILWANRYCLLDTSSGASRSAREILRRLAALGHEVRVVGATIFDAPSGVTGLGGAWDALRKSDKKISNVQDGNLTHQLVRTADTASTRMTLDELNSLYALYRSNLTEFSPDVVFFYGGNSFDMLIPLEARREGALTCAYLVNANYRGHRWYDDVDLVFTDSVATSRFYKEELGLDVTPIGKFIDPAAVVPAERTPERVTFINPSIEKGAALVAQLALHMEKTRPDITFEIVESRGNWGAMLEAVQKGTKKRKSLKNVVVTPNTTDMRPVFGRSRVLLVPSLWWESGARVLAEATLNGIPVIASDRGGNAEMIGDSGVKLQLPPEMYEPPYGQLLSEGAVNSLSKIVERLFDDEAYHAEQSQRSLAVGRSQHNCEANARAFERLLSVATTIKKKRLPTLKSSGVATAAAAATQSERYPGGRPRICVVTLACGEPQLEANRAAIAAQDYPVSMHHVIENLPNLEAHRACYNYIMDHSDRYDIFVKLDADMVPRHQQFIAEVARTFSKKRRLDHLVVPVHDWLTASQMIGLHAFSNHVSWPKVDDPVFVDPDPKIRGSRETQYLENLAVDHMPSPTSYQSYVFGWHRGIKIATARSNSEAVGRLKFHLSILKNLKAAYSKNATQEQRLWALNGYADVFEKRQLELRDKRDVEASFKKLERPRELDHIEEILNQYLVA